MDYTEINDLANEYLICRTLGHAWDENPNAEVDSDLFKSSRGCVALRCVRCATERFDYLANDLTVYQRYYRYPDQYKTIPGIATRPVLRGEMLERGLLFRQIGKKVKHLRLLKEA